MEKTWISTFPSVSGGTKFVVTLHDETDALDTSKSVELDML